MTITLYRVRQSSDDKTTTDKIVFNNATNENRHGGSAQAYCISIKRGPTFGVADNQGATQDLGDLQTLGKVEEAFILDCIITKRDDSNGSNAYLNRLKTWEDDPKTSTTWPEGRFGLEDTGDHNNDVIPVGTGSNQVGLILEYIQYESELSKNLTRVSMKLRVSKGDGT